MAEQADRPLPPHVTTPLLTLITTRSMDEDYAHVARRRAEGGPSASGGNGRGHWTTPAVVAVFGVLATVVAVQTSRDADVAELGRAALTAQINVGRDELTALQRSVTTLEEANRQSASRNDTLAAQEQDLENNVRRLEIRTGFVAVRGEGVRMTIASSPGADDTQEIRDEDLATLVDGLWQAGAEAVAINGQRINVLGGIRNTGRAIHINGRPLTSPYVVEAIGDTGTLQANLLRSSEGQEWFALVNGLGFSYVAQNVNELRLPAAPLRQLRQVTEGTAADNVGKPQEKEAKP
jgi:uncharacterized protein YlxW (UPF0749 family)